MPVPPEEHDSPAAEDASAQEFAHSLGQALRDTAPGLAPASAHADLAERGLRSGRVRLGRRRAAAVTGSVLALALAGTGGALAGGLIGGEGPATTAGPADTPLPGPSTDPTKVPRQKKEKSPVSGAEVLKVLEKLLPEGEVSERTGGADFGPPGASLVFDDGKGKAAIGADLTRYGKDDPQREDSTTCPGRAYVPYDSCRAETLPDGARLMVLAGYEYADRRGDNKSWDAYLVTTEGYAIHVGEHNAPAEKGKPATRDIPPLSLSLLETAVRSDSWLPLAGKLPDPAPQPSGKPGRTHVTRTARGLLPSALTVREARDSDSFGSLVVDDGKGRGLVEINADSGFTRGEEGDGGGETLPDGSTVTTAQGPAEKGARGVVAWTVQVVRPGGDRIAVSAYNAAGHKSAPTRETPALTLKQIRALALDEAWQK